MYFRCTHCRLSQQYRSLGAEVADALPRRSDRSNVRVFENHETTMPGDHGPLVSMITVAMLRYLLQIGDDFVLVGLIKGPRLEICTKLLRPALRTKGLAGTISFVMFWHMSIRKRVKRGPFFDVATAVYSQQTFLSYAFGFVSKWDAMSNDSRLLMGSCSGPLRNDDPCSSRRADTARWQDITDKRHVRQQRHIDKQVWSSTFYNSGLLSINC